MYLWNGLFIKVGLSHCKKNVFICFIESCLKMMKNAFYLMLKALFILEILILKFMQYIYCPICLEVKLTRQWNLVS